MIRPKVGTYTSDDGGVVAEALRGAWRFSPPRLDLPLAELQRLEPLFLKSGVAALVHWRARNSAPRNRPVPRSFHEAHKLQILAASIHQTHIKTVFNLFDAARIQAVLVKGWAIARQYPRPALRPYGDLDICVRPEQFDRAKGVLARPETKGIWIDLHHGFKALDAENELDLFARSQEVRLDGVPVYIPSAEDHLRMLCLHLLRHGAWRPVWLCDIALAMESTPSGFDWERFYGSDPQRAAWVRCVLGLARELLGARIEEPPAERIADISPTGRVDYSPARWLVKTVLRRWGRWFNGDYRDKALPSLARHWWQPSRVLEDLYFRFDPLRATVETNGSFNASPRLPYQIASILRRSLEAPAWLRRRKQSAPIP
jgi:hypothetical protein